METFISDVHETSVETLGTRIEEIERRVALLDQTKAEKTREQERIQNEFRLREDTADVRTAVCEKYSAVARIDDLLGEYLRNRIGATLLAKAMAIYRAKNQDPLLKRAGEYFAALTCGGFEGLHIEQEESGGS